MPQKKDLKRLVRSRMQKTGESYTTARSQIVKTRKAPSRAAYAKAAGISEDSVRSKTGAGWKTWVSRLDAVKAFEMPHREIAIHVREHYDVSAWWAQSITVAYERIRGLRDVGQRRGGSFDANKSKTFPVPVSTLYRAFARVQTRSQWLSDADPRVRTSRQDKSVRMDWPDGTRVSAYFTEKNSEKSQVAIQHSGLATKRASDTEKERWARRLRALADWLRENDR